MKEDLSKWYMQTIPINEKLEEFSKKYEISIEDFKDSIKKSYEIFKEGNFLNRDADISLIAFFRHIVKVPEDYTKFDPYEKLAETSGPRYQHENFCIISDFPCVMKRDENDFAHCENMPAIIWRDGSMMFVRNGKIVPAYFILKDY